MDGGFLRSEIRWRSLGLGCRAATLPSTRSHSSAPHNPSPPPPRPSPSTPEKKFGTVVDDPLDGQEGRLTKAERRATLTQQLLADAPLSQSRKRRFGTLQAEAEAKVTRGKRRKTENERRKAPQHRPKH